MFQQGSALEWFGLFLDLTDKGTDEFLNGSVWDLNACLHEGRSWYSGWRTVEKVQINFLCLSGPLKDSPVCQMLPDSHFFSFTAQHLKE